MYELKIVFVCRDIERSDEKIVVSTSGEKKINTTGNVIIKHFKETTIKDEINGDTIGIFFCPPTDKKQGWKEFRTELRSWLDGETKKVSYVDKCHLRGGSKQEKQD